MNRIILGCLAALAITLLAQNLAPTSSRIVRPVYAATGCTDASLSGSYAVIQPSGLSGNRAHAHEVPWQYVGVETFDGTGNTSVSYTAALDGAVYTNQTGGGTYTVNSDCTGSVSLTSGDAAGLTANFSLANNATEIFGIVTNTGDTATFVEKKQ